MFSNLGPLFKSTFRQAESSDTRQKIPHEEIDPEPKKHDEQEKKPSDSELWQDNTVVSVESLKAFLVNFLATMPEAKEYNEHNQIEENSEFSRPKEPTRPTNTHNAKAVRAYQTMAAQSHSGSMNTQNAAKPAKNKNNKDLIQSQELRDIYQLIENLDILKQRGVETLNIQKAGTFVESLKNAVRLLL